MPVTLPVYEELIPATPDVYILKVAPGTDPQQLATSLGVSLERVLSSNTIVVSGVLDESQLENDADVTFFEPNQEVGLAFGEELTMGFFEGENFTPTALRSSPVMGHAGLEYVHSQSTGRGIRVGIIDTGADSAHPWLTDRVGPSENCDALGWEEEANGLDDDGDLLIDEAYGHGTMVAGIVAQLAPSAEMISIRALNSDGFGSLADLLTAMDALLEDGVDVVNLSLSLSSYSSTFEERVLALKASGAVIVAAAGNQSGPTAYPASSSHVIGVAAAVGETTLAGFSNAGPDCELSANGVGILSSFPEDQLGWGDGTSFAAPVVSGALALLRASELDEQLLLQTAIALPPLAFGQIDVAACFAARGLADRRHEIHESR